MKPVSGSEDERIVLASANRKVPTDWSPDGRLIVFQQESAGKQFGLYALPLGAEPKPVVLVDFEFDEIQGAVSPDGRWLAYASNETGLYEVYVRTFAPGAPAAPTSTRVSINGAAIRSGGGTAGSFSICRVPVTWSPFPSTLAGPMFVLGVPMNCLPWALRS